MAAPDVDWPRLWLEAIGSVASAVFGLLVGVWRWGRQSALRDVALREEFTARMDEMREEHQSRLDELREAFGCIRRQIDDNRLLLEQAFVRKDDSEKFRYEIREDLREVKAMISDLRAEMRR